MVFTVQTLTDKISAANDATATKKYEQFFDSIKSKTHYDQFGNPAELAAAVSTAISNYKRKRGELGRLIAPFATAAEYFAWLLDPKKYFNHPWGLVGRKDVLERIRGFATGKALWGCCGAGGLGKSKILLEFANTFDEQATGWKIRFLRETTAGRT